MGREGVDMSRFSEREILTKGIDFDQIIAESTMSDTNPNNEIVLEGAGVVIQRYRSVARNEKQSDFSQDLREFMIVACLVCLAIDVFFSLFPFQDLPLISPFVWWASSRGYLSLRKGN